MTEMPLRLKEIDIYYPSGCTRRVFFWPGQFSLQEIDRRDAMTKCRLILVARSNLTPIEIYQKLHLPARGATLNFKH